MLVGVLAGGIVAIVLGYFMFYGGVNDVFVGLTTLALTLVLQTFMAQTAGDEWTVGEARLNGYNGMYVPQISIGDMPLYGKPLYFLYLGIVIGVYLLLRWLAGSRWGMASWHCRRTGRGRRPSATTCVSCRCRSSVSRGAWPR